MLEINEIEKCYRSLKSQNIDVIRLFSGNPIDEGFLFPGEILSKSYSDYFKTLDYHPHSKGLPEARQAIQKYYRKSGVTIDSENILLTSGTSESFSYLFNLLAEPGDNILTPNPAYPLFDPIAELKQLELRHYPLVEENHWRVDLEALKDLTDARTKAIVIISPHNPTGSVMSAEEINDITAWANEKKIPLICDEVFSEFYFGAGDFPRTIAIAKPNLCFTLNGLSKMYALPSMKLSWIVVTGEAARVNPVIERLELMLDTFLTCHTAIQKALPTIFDQGSGFLESYQRELKSRRDLAVHLLEKCPDVSFVSPEGSFYLMGKILKDLPYSEEEFVIKLMEEKHVFVHPGYFFDYDDGIHFIISFLTTPKRLERGIQALIEFL